MKVCFVTDGIEAPASRFRVQQFLPAYRAAGVTCRLTTAYGHAYNRLLGRPLVSTVYKLACGLKRAATTLGSIGYDVVLLQRLALPHTSFPEGLRGRYGSPLVFDFDDALWIGADLRPSRLRGRAFRGALRAADCVVAGNHWLARQADVAEKTVVIPTVIDTDVYAPATQPRSSELVVGWMGTAPNFPSLRMALPGVLDAIAQVPGARLRIVSNGRLSELEGDSRVEQLAWTAASEVELLRSFDVGLMPLEDTEVNWGKCGFKMIQYMAVGCAVAASAVGANVDIFSGSDAGVLVPPGASFRDAVLQLLSDAELRHRMGTSGRAHAVRGYSIEAAAPRYLSIFDALANGQRLVGNATGVDVPRDGGHPPPLRER